MTTKKNTVDIQLPEMKIANFKLKIVGDTPLICHAWSHKAKLMLADTGKKKATAGKPEYDPPHVEFAETLYWLSEKPGLAGLPDDEAAKILAQVIPQSKFGSPTTAFKAAALDAGFQQGILAAKAGNANALAKTTARGAFRIPDEFAVIEGIPTMRDDMVKIGKGTRIAYRAEFKSWQTELGIIFNTLSISAEQIINLINVGGFAIGVGDWRPEKGGSFGTFHVVA